jgi:hypothetical protein
VVDGAWRIRQAELRAGAQCASTSPRISKIPQECHFSTTSPAEPGCRLDSELLGHHDIDLQYVYKAQDKTSVVEVSIETGH